MEELSTSYHTAFVLKGTIYEIRQALHFMLRVNGPKAQVRYL